MPTVGERIAEQVRERVPDISVVIADNMSQAVSAARGLLPRGGTVLVSPAAPSFSQYHNWEERSADFSHVVRALLNS